MKHNFYPKRAPFSRHPKTDSVSRRKSFLRVRWKRSDLGIERCVREWSRRSRSGIALLFLMWRNSAFAARSHPGQIAGWSNERIFCTVFAVGRTRCPTRPIPSANVITIFFLPSPQDTCSLLFIAEEFSFRERATWRSIFAGFNEVDALSRFAFIIVFVGHLENNATIATFTKIWMTKLFWSKN